MRVHAAITEGNGDFAIETIGMDAPLRGEFLIAMKVSGVCNTDWNSLRWRKRLVLGHEGAGGVLAVGLGVSRFAPGDRVILNWAIPCWTCFQCECGKEIICENRGTVPDERYHHVAAQ